MSGNITIDSTTSAEQLHKQVYDSNLDNYAAVYADLIEQYPDFQKLISDALTFTSNFSLQQDSFVSFINEQISDLYEEISDAAFPSDDDEVDPIIDEL